MPSSRRRRARAGRVTGTRSASGGAGLALEAPPVARHRPPADDEQRGGHHDDRPPGPAGRRRRPRGRAPAPRTNEVRPSGDGREGRRRHVRDEQVPPAARPRSPAGPAPRPPPSPRARRRRRPRRRRCRCGERGEAADSTAIASPRHGSRPYRSPRRPTGSLRAVVSRASLRASERSGSEPRSYVVRTFGCQMNEHDSERIAGLLEADGMVRGRSESTTPTSSCSTRAASARTPTTSCTATSATSRRGRTRATGRQIVVSGCLAQKDRELVRQQAGHVDVVMGTHNVHRAAELLHEARRGGPITEILEAAVLDDHALFPSALPAVRETSYNAWVTIQIGCDNSCAFCIVPSVRGVEICRPFDEIVGEVGELAAAGVTEVTLLGQNVNSYGRDLQLAARRDGDADARVRPLFADLLRAVGAVDGIRRVRFTSPAPQGHAPRDVRRDGRDAGRLRAAALPAAGRLRPRARGDAPRLHRRALPRPPRRGPPRRARPRRVDRHHRRLPGRDRRRLRGHAGGRRRGPVRRRLHVHLLAPPRHRGGRR